MHWLLALPLALAEPDPAAHLQAAADASRAEQAGDWAGADAACARAIDAQPDGPRADRCARRRAWLATRQDTDGGWDAWGALESARRSARDAGPDATRAAVEAVLTRTDAPPLVRAEAYLWLAEDDQRRGDVTAADAHSAAGYDLRTAVPDDVARQLALQRGRVLALTGKPDEALAVEGTVTLRGSPRQSPVQELLAAQRDARVRNGAWATVGVFLLLTVPSARAPRPGLRPWGLVPLGVGLAGAWAIGHGWEAGVADAIPWMAPGLVLVHLLTAVAQDGASRVRAAVVGVASALASLAIAWLALDHTLTLPQVWW